MIIEIETPDGKVIEIEAPEGATNNQIQEVVTQVSSQYTPEKKETSSWAGRFAHGLADPILGAGQLAYNASPNWYKNFTTKSDKFLYDNTNGILGKNTEYNQFIKNRENQYQNELPVNEGIDEARMLGNVVTGLLGTKGMAAPKTIGGAIAQGGAVGGGMSAAAPVSKEGDYWDNKKQDAALGTLFGMPFGAGGHMISRLVSPNAAANQGLRQLQEAGINPTTGQTLGGWTNKAEQTLSSLPFLGHKITQARQATHDQFNKAMLDKIVKPFGEKVDEIGHTGIKQAHTIVSKAYDDVLDSTPGFKLDKKGIDELNNLMILAKELPADELLRFKKFFQGDLSKKFSSVGGIESHTYKALDSKLRRLVEQTKNKEINTAFQELRSILNHNAQRANPEFAQKLNVVDEAYSRLSSMDVAASKAALKEGVFTPGQALNAIKQNDKTVRKNKFSQGEKLDQNFAGLAQQILGNTVPDSGTAGRGFMGTLLTSGGAMIDPATTMLAGGGLLTSSALYTPLAQKGLNLLFTKRPEFAKPLSEVISKSTPFLAPGLMAGY